MEIIDSDRYFSHLYHQLKSNFHVIIFHLSEKNKINKFKKLEDFRASSFPADTHTHLSDEMRRDGREEEKKLKLNI